MRLKERTLVTVRHAPRIAVTGELGSVSEGFSADTTALRASVLPRSGELTAEEKGARTRETIQLLLPMDARAECGDGVWVNGVLWRIIAVRRWSAHVEWICEALA